MSKRKLSRVIQAQDEYKSADYREKFMLLFLAAIMRHVPGNVWDAGIETAHAALSRERKTRAR